MTNVPDLSQFRPAPTTVSTPRIGEEIERWVEAIVTPAISWEIGLSMIPTPQGLQPGFVILLRLPSPVLGQVLLNAVLVDLGSLTEQAVTHHVRNVVEQLHQQRAALLATPPATNGGQS